MLLRLFSWRREERGAALVTVIVLLTVCFTAVTVVTSTSVFGQRQTQLDQSQVQALSAAEAGRDALLQRLAAHPQSCPASIAPTILSGSGATAVTYSASVASCASSQVTIQAVGQAPGATKTVRATYPFQPGATITTTATTRATSTATATTTTAATVATALGGIIQGNPASSALNLPTVVVNNGDLLVASTGTFDCNSNSVINGSLVVPNGSVSLSNKCTIAGSVYAKGDIQISNLGNHVAGDLVSTNGDITINAGSVDGSVLAHGIVTLTSATVGKTGASGTQVVAASTAASSIYNSTIRGAVSLGGYFSQLQATTVTGNVSATSTSQSSIAPDTTIGGNLTLAGPSPSTWNNGPTVTGSKRYNVTGMTRPTVSTPSAMTRATWLEIPWKPSNWTSAGWTVQTATASQCDYQSNTALVAAVNNLTTPTVIDASACGTSGLKLYGATFSLRTNVTFIAPTTNTTNKNDEQNLTVNANGSGSRTFNIIVPDSDPTDNAPTCPSKAATDTTIYAAVLGTGVSGIAYSPCTLDFGNAVWTGQIIAGDPNPAGGNVTLAYQGVGVPGATISGSGGTATISALATSTTTTTTTATTKATSTTSPTMLPSPSLLSQVEP